MPVGTTKPRSSSTRNWFKRRARIAALPVGVSIAIHALLLVFIGTITWTVVGAGPPAPLGGDVLIDLDDPSISPLVVGNQELEPVETPTPIAPTTTPTQRPSQTSAGATMSAPVPRFAPTERRPVDMQPLRRRGGISFAGVQADRAASVVYVVDTSGAMASSFALIIDELERSLSRLDPSQLFQVISFRDRTIIDPTDTTKASLMAGPGLVNASPANRTRVIRALRETVLPSGRSDPSPALELALSLEPDAVFLLTRSIRRTGPGQDNDPAPADATLPWSEPWRDKLLASLEELNPRGPRGRRTLIKAIQFLDHDPTGTLQTIGTRHGGDAGYVVRSPADLQQLAKAPPPVHIELRANVDQAGQYLNDLASKNLDWQVLFGYPTDAERETVIRIAQRAINEISRAQGMTDASALLHLARSAILVAAAADGTDRSESIAIARDALTKLSDAVDERAAWHRDHLRTLLASLDGTANERAILVAPTWGDRDLQIEHMLAQLRAGAVDSFVQICALSLESLYSPPVARAHEDGRVEQDPALVVLAIDAMTQRAMQIARTFSPTDQTWVRFAIARVLYLRSQDWLEYDQRETLILDRIDRVLASDVDLAVVQPEATLALARRRLQGDDPRSAETLLRDILFRDDADHLAPRALVAISDLQAEDPAIVRRARAPMALMTLQEGWPDAPEAADAVQRALFLSRSILDTADASERVIALNHYHQVLGDARALRDLENRDYWLAQHDMVLLALARHHDSNFSLHLLERIRPGSPEAPTAVSMYRRLVRISIREMHELHHEAKGVPGREDDAEVSLEAAERHARNALALYRAHGVREDTAVERESLARTYNLMGLHIQEITALEALLPYAEELAGGSPPIQVRIAAVERALDEDEQAFTRLRAVTQQTEPADEVFWHAWTLVLEILRDQNADAQRTGTILAHIAMLRTLDEGLGQDPWRSRILAISQNPTP